jgi:hypothetical protein
MFTGATCTLFVAGPLLSSVAWSSAFFPLTHKNGGKKAEDQATELNQGPAVNSVHVALPEDGTIECRNTYKEVRNK